MRQFLTPLCAAVVLSTLMGMPAFANEQRCENGVDTLKGDGVVWKKSVECGAVSFPNASLRLGDNAASTKLTTDIRYEQLPSAHSGIRAKFKNADGLSLGHMSFGGLHIDCTDENVVRAVEAAGPGGTVFDFADRAKIATVELALWVGDGNFTNCH